MFKHNSSMFPIVSPVSILPPPSHCGFVQGGTKSWRSSRSIAWIVDCTPRRPAVERPCRSQSTENYLLLSSLLIVWSFDWLIWFDLIVWSFDRLIVWLIDWFGLIDLVWLIWFDLIWLIGDWLIDCLIDWLIDGYDSILFDLIWFDWLVDFIWFGLVCFDLIDWKKGWCGWIDWTNKIWFFNGTWSIDELLWFICLWKMVIIHSYVKLPEGNKDWFMS